MNEFTYGNASIEPLRLTEEEFMCGADGADPWCRQKFADYIADISCEIEPDSRCPVPGYPDGEYVFAMTNCPVLLHCPAGQSTWSIVGYYDAPGAVCIHEDHQGRGLGAELILYTAVEFADGPPTAALDEQSFSKAGYAAHLAAYRLGVERGLIVKPSVEYVRKRGMR